MIKATGSWNNIKLGGREFGNVRAIERGRVWRRCSVFYFLYCYVMFCIDLLRVC